MNIYEEFEKWLDDLLESSDMPENTIAFNFNLYEEDIKEHIYAIQLIAADEFDLDDGEWACSEVWSSEENIFCIDISDEDETDWKRALKLFTDMAAQYLESGKYRNILLSSKGVGIGFVDGDLELIYKT